MKFNNLYFLKLNYGFKNSIKFEGKIYHFNKEEYTQVPEGLYKLYYLKTADYTCSFQGANCPVKINFYLSKIERIAVDDEEQLEDLAEGNNKLNLALEEMVDKEAKLELVENPVEEPEKKAPARRTSNRKTSSRKIK